MPRVRGRILPPATSTRIRLLKATNFTILQTARSRASSYRLSCLTTVDELETLHNLSNRAGQHHAELLSPSANCQNSSIVTSDHADETTVLGCAEDGVTQKVKVVLHVDSRTGSPRKSMPLPTRKHTFPFSLISPKRRNSTAIPLDLGVDSDVVTSVTREASIEISPWHSPQNGFDDSAEKTPLSQRLNRQSNRHSLPSDLGSLDNEITPIKGRAVNRQARMIDGALFQGKTRKGKSIRGNTKNDTLPSEQKAQVCSHPQQTSRVSWLHTLLNRLQSKQRRKHAESEHRKQRSSLGDCGLLGQITRDSSESLRQTEATLHLPQIDKAPATFNMGLDGAYDDEHNNKPLPLSPFENSARPSIQSETERYIFQQSPQVAIFDFRKPFASPQSVKSRQEDELRSLVSATMSGPPELSQREKEFKYRYSDNSPVSPPIS